jgi:endonuclease/exonuclease/phosphatase (EEP) superfamily protein YafD
METIFRIFRRILFILGYAGFAVFFALLFLCSANQMDWIPRNTWFYGFDYIPSLWLLVASVPIGLILFEAGKKWPACATWGAAVIFYLAFGDYSVKEYHRTEMMNHRATTGFSVLALNVQYYTQGLEKVMGFIRETNPAVALLSENTLGQEEVAKHAALVPGYSFFVSSQKELLILSKYPFLQCEDIMLPSFEASLSGKNRISEQTGHLRRSLIHAVIDIHGVPVNVLCIRLIAGRAADHSLAENVRWGKYLLATQQKEDDFILEYLSTLSGPVVFGGDLNATPGSKVIRSFNTVARDAVLSLHILGGATFRTTFPSMRLDYLFFTPPLVPLKADVLNRVVSDHFPVYAVFGIDSVYAGRYAAW